MNLSSRIDPQTRRYQEATEWLFRLQEDSPTTEQIIEWVEWCCADPANRRAFEHLMPVWKGFDAAHDDPAIAAQLAAEHLSGMEFREDATLHSALAERRPLRPQRDWARLKRPGWLALAASVILGVGCLALWRNAQVVTLAATADFQSAVGQVREANLPDGSHINLGARSDVAIDFQGTQRQIEIRNGEAYFAVKHDETRPFVVKAGFLQVVAVGTAFDVLRSGDRITVSVEEGTVAVTTDQGGGAAPVQVSRGSQIIFDALNPGSSKLRTLNPESAAAWRKGRLEYVDEPLSAVVANLNRYSAEPISYTDERLGQLRFTGTIELNSLDEWLQALPSIFPVQVAIGADHRVALQLRAVATP